MNENFKQLGMINWKWIELKLQMLMLIYKILRFFQSFRGEEIVKCHRMTFTGFNLVQYHVI